MWLEEIMERVIISALRQCFLQLDYRGLGCFSEYSSRSDSGLQPCVVELPSNILMLTAYRAGANGNWSMYRGLATANPMEYRGLKLHSRTDMLILDVTYRRIRTLSFTVWRGEVSYINIRQVTVVSENYGDSNHLTNIRELQDQTPDTSK